MRRITIFITGLALAATACSGSTVTTEVLPSSTSSTSQVPRTSTDPNESIIFGSGSIPDTIPADFPFPSQAVIGSTLVDRDRSLTEVIIRIATDVAVLASFYDDNLAANGYEVVSSAGGDTAWDIEFTNDSVTGTIAVTLGGQSVSQAVIRMTADA